MKSWAAGETLTEFRTLIRGTGLSNKKKNITETKVRTLR